MVEKNYRIWCVMNGVFIDEIVIEDGVEDVDMEVEDVMYEDDDVGVMEVDGDDDVLDFFKEFKVFVVLKIKSKCKKIKVVELVREKICKVFEDVIELVDKCVGKCDEGDFLWLLYVFNEEGIYFL